MSILSASDEGPATGGAGAAEGGTAADEGGKSEAAPPHNGSGAVTSRHEAPPGGQCPVALEALLSVSMLTGPEGRRGERQD